MKKAICYVNQFFGGVGGENDADFEPIIQEGTLGPVQAIQAALKDVQITHTVVCGDNFMASHKDEAISRIKGFLEGKKFDLFLAGPAFRAGRYGVSCGEMCKFVVETYGVPAVTSMHEENPGVEMFQEEEFYIMKGSASAAKMRQDVALMAGLANKLAAREEILWADAEGYFPHGIRREVWVDKIAADRTVDMLLDKIAGRPFETEFKIEVRDNVVPSPARDMTKTKIALITTGGLVPIGNPDRLPGGTCSVWLEYDVSQMDSLKAGDFYSVHCGINTDYVNADPEVLLPLSSFREAVKEGKLAGIHDYMVVTTGNLATGKDARNMGRGIAQLLRDKQIEAALLVST
jgi:selenoprotein B, glycine/betaine/sarcosine/D-proline reductase family